MIRLCLHVYYSIRFRWSHPLMNYNVVEFFLCDLWLLVWRSELFWMIHNGKFIIKPPLKYSRLVSLFIWRFREFVGRFPFGRWQCRVDFNFILLRRLFHEKSSNFTLKTLPAPPYHNSSNLNVIFQQFSMRGQKSLPNQIQVNDTFICHPLN